MPGDENGESNQTSDAGKKKDAGKRGDASRGEDDDDTPPPPAPGDKSDGGAYDSGRQPQQPPSPTPTGTTTSTPPPPPPATPFLQLDVRYPVEAGRYITQCTPDAKTQLVWTTTAQGRDEYSRWANASYKETPGANYACGTKTNGEYPIVMSWTNADGIPNGTWVARCVGSKQAHVYRVTAVHAGHPAATFQYAEGYASCP
jgi:hypothetical protein